MYTLSFRGGGARNQGLGLDWGYGPKTHLEILAVDAFAGLGAEDGGLEALAIFFETEGLFAIAALVVACNCGVRGVLLT